MKEEISNILGNYILNRGNDVVSQLHKAFIQAQIEMLNGLMKLKATETSDEDDGQWDYIYYSDVEQLHNTLTNLLEDE